MTGIVYLFDFRNPERLVRLASYAIEGSTFSASPSSGLLDFVRTSSQLFLTELASNCSPTVGFVLYEAYHTSRVPAEDALEAAHSGALFSVIIGRK